jgi:hypothetical protein
LIADLEAGFARLDEISARARRSGHASGTQHSSA